MPSRCWTALACPDSVGELRNGAAEFVHAHVRAERVLHDLRLAVSEAVSNVVLHAYREEEAPGRVAVEVAVEPGARTAEVTVSDEGTGLTPRTDSPGAGLGMPLIHRLADEVEYRTPPGGGTELWMRFRL